MSKRRGDGKSEGGGAQQESPEPAATSREASLHDCIGSSPMNAGICVKCPEEGSYLSDEKRKELDALDRTELERRLHTSECCLTQAKEALVNAQASAEMQRKGCETALAEQKDMLARTLADFDNYRKRVERERDGWLRDGRAEGACASLDTLDNLDRAMASLPEASREGIAKVRASLLASLKALGLEELDPMKMPFDPNLHEAVLTGEAEGVADDIVIEVLAKGYSLCGKLLRPAKVKVSKSR